MSHPSRHASGNVTFEPEKSRIVCSEYHIKQKLHIISIRYIPTKLLRDSTAAISCIRYSTGPLWSKISTYRSLPLSMALPMVI